MKLDPKLMQQLLETFKVELEDQLQIITDGLLLLEKPQDDAAKQETLNGIFRAAHNIKGAARGVSVTAVAEISHHLESLFSVLKQGGLEPVPAVIDLCLTTLDYLREAMQAHNDGRDPNFDQQALHAQLDSAAQTGVVDTAAVPVVKSAKAPVKETKEEAPAAKQAPISEAPPVDKEVSNTENDETVTVATTKSSSEVIRVTVDKLDRVSALAEELQVAKIGMDEHFSGMQSVRGHVEGLSALWSRVRKVLKRNGNDELSSELRQIMTNSMDTMQALDDVSGRMHKDMRGTTNRLGFISTALQGDMRMLRLVPASTLLRPMVRSVRDIARQLNKQIKLDIIGDEIEMDRAVLEGLRDPLVHLLRNAIDHGIESPDERTAASKTEEGGIVLTVMSEGGQIQITIEDDGRGV